MILTKKELIRWRKNTIVVAKKLGYHGKYLHKKPEDDEDIFEHIINKVPLKLTKGFPPKDNWFGWCRYNFGKPEIEIYSKNLSCVSQNIIIEALQKDKLPQKKIEKIIKHMKSISKSAFFEVYNQSGMDHEIMGHLFHYLKGKEHGEEVSVKIQIKFAEYRAKKMFGSKKWKQIIKIMPVILGHHKDIDELKH